MTQKKIFDLQLKIKQSLSDQDKYLIDELDEITDNSESIYQRDIYLHGFLDGVKLTKL